LVDVLPKGELVTLRGADHFAPMRGKVAEVADAVVKAFAAGCAQSEPCRTAG
jgi:hypothetical protein